jgi:hypothetical protein
MRKSFIITISLCLGSCATVLSGPKQWVPINTLPQGATVKVNGNVECVTPCILRLKREKVGPKIELELEDYKKTRLELKTKWNETSAINNINPIFWGIDYYAGTLIKYRPVDTILLTKRKN